MLAQREAIAFVQLDCVHCGTQTLALVTGIPLDDEDAEAALDAFEAGRAETLTRGRPAGFADGRGRGDDEPISNADVDEMRAFLAGYHGDLRTLVDRHERGGGAGRR